MDAISHLTLDCQHEDTAEVSLAERRSSYQHASSDQIHLLYISKMLTRHKIASCLQYCLLMSTSLNDGNMPLPHKLRFPL